MGPNDLDRLIEKYLDGKCTPEEFAFVQKWYASLGQDFSRQHAATPPETDLAAMRMHERISRHAEADIARTRHVLRRPAYLGIAAMVCIALAVGWYVSSQPVAEQLTEIQTDVEAFTAVENTSSVLKRVILPDGSIVEMSPASRIRYPNDATAPTRELFLHGEAYFDVAHNNQRPFYVYAGNIVTKVLGTSFMIRARAQDETVVVSVKTGKVSVYPKNAVHKKTVLVPNQEAVYDLATDVMATQPVPAAQRETIRRNDPDMHFEETPVPQVLAELMSTYNIDIVYETDDLSACVLTSSFYEEGLYDRVDVICTAIGATYRIVDARIVIESDGCNLKNR